MNVTLQERCGESILVVEGEIDHASVGALTAAFQVILDRNSSTLLLDLSKVTYMDSAGLSALYELAEKAKDRRPVEITRVSSFLWRVSEVAGLTVDERVHVAAEAAGTCDRSAAARQKSAGRHGPQSETRTFPPTFDQLALIRDFVEEVAADSALDDARAFDLKVAVSEASANAIEHGLSEGNIEVSARRTRGRLTVKVSHPGPFSPRADGDPTRAHRGMGLPLMLALTNELTVSSPKRGGTSVALSMFLD